MFAKTMPLWSFNAQRGSMLHEVAKGRRGEGAEEVQLAREEKEGRGREGVRERGSEGDSRGVGLGSNLLWDAGGEAGLGFPPRHPRDQALTRLEPSVRSMLHWDTQRRIGFRLRSVKTGLPILHFFYSAGRRVAIHLSPHHPHPDQKSLRELGCIRYSDPKNGGGETT
ncbi:hypothetical protein IE53DRAFT_105978 [Violaceomyces palustris]|uniref:Uncharacterized protein n=1 Tax=Violaceomyces palustris TaxID=1673888 RepID=A0ACD0NWR7_9BASI|nr:hypothetical protein IE53DRAFT_105978 [Violaceomyces palustris]